MLEIYDDKSWSDKHLANLAHTGESEVVFYPANTPTNLPKRKRKN